MQGLPALLNDVENRTSIAILCICQLVSVIIMMHYESTTEDSVLLPPRTSACDPKDRLYVHLVCDVLSNGEVFMVPNCRTIEAASVFPIQQCVAENECVCDRNGNIVVLRFDNNKYQENPTTVGLIAEYGEYGNNFTTFLPSLYRKHANGGT